MAAVVGTGTVLGTGTASAATVTSGSCTGPVDTHIGDTVSMQGAAVASKVKQAVDDTAKKRLVIVGTLGMDPNKAADTIKEAGALTVGHMSNEPSAAVPGKVIADAVAQKLRDAGKSAGLGWGQDQIDDSLNHIKAEISGTCGLTAKAVDYRAPSSAPSSHPSSSAPSAPAQQHSSTPGAPTGTAPTPGNVALGNGATQPMRDYSATPSGVPGAYAPPPGQRYGVPGYAPTAGQLGPKQGRQQPQADPVHTAGRATKLADPSQNSSKQVGIPMLIAVIALAGVSAALVRTWALRRL